ncbi:hypothetical protein [Photobacterium angustum]|uniref:hypothetical protein n=1 Tax=Photobacterium angustum TaxID=661 RepID=UPI0005E18EA1|nr:hypothetical protein [Photobacterium angustum]KJG00105.1 hypothetical protein UB35_19840 [Photobacterium angustum]PSV61663.1 hypothetical protein CTM95_20390 [Photobacterium angustum]
MNITKITAASTAAACALLSGVLTFQFMSDIAVILGLMGICLEIAKFILPHLAHSLWQSKSYIKSLALSSVLLVLVALSFAASVYSVNTATNTAHKQSDQYAALTIQIEQAQAQVSHLTKINHITKSAQIAATIPSLISQRAKLRGDTLLDTHGQLIAIVVAGAIELVSLALALALFSSKTAEDAPRQKHDQGQDKEEAKPVLAQDSKIRLVHSVQEPKTVTIQAKTNVEDEIKQAVRQGAFDSVTVSAIAQVFPINRNRINAVLNRMVDEGVLLKQGNRRILAA